MSDCMIFVPVLKNTSPGLYHVIASADKSEILSWKVNGYTTPELSEKLSDCFKGENKKITLGAHNIETGEPLTRINGSMGSVCLGLYLASFQKVYGREFKTAWDYDVNLNPRNTYDTITVTGDIELFGNTIKPKPVIFIKEKLDGVIRYAINIKHSEQNHLFIYINDEDKLAGIELPPNLVVKRFSPDVSIHDIANQVFRVPSPDEFRFIPGAEITAEDAEQALNLDYIVYGDLIKEEEQWTVTKCQEFHAVENDIYFMIRDVKNNQIISYVNLAPVTEDCFNFILSGKAPDIDLKIEDLHPYKEPGLYSLLFTSLVIHPAYRNRGILVMLFDKIIEKIISLKDREIYIKMMVADVVSKEGERACRLFGMKFVTKTEHNSKIFKTSFLPTEFRKCPGPISRLFAIYQDMSDKLVDKK